LQKRSGLEDEVAGAGGDWLLGWLGSPQGVVANRDEILSVIAPSRTRPQGGNVEDCYSLYETMRRTDLKFKSLVTTRKNGVLSREWRVVENPGDPDEARAQKAAELVRTALGELDDFRRDLRELLDAVPVGFAVSEVIWAERGGRWVPASLKQRRQGRFGFTGEGELRYSPTKDDWAEVPPMKFLVYSHAPVNENPYGCSEAAELFWWWFFKHQFVKWWMVFGEKWGMPTAIGKYPPGANKELRDKLLRALKRIQTEYAVTIPENVEVSLLEATRAGNVNSYETFCEYSDRGMSEALTGQSLATGQGTMGTGSYAQADVHAGVKQEFVEADSCELMGVVNSQLVRWIVDLNMGPDVPAPLWVIDYESVDLAADLAIDQGLISAGVPMSKRYFYEHYKRPEPDGEDDEVVGNGPGGWLGGWGNDGGDGGDGTYRTKGTKRVLAGGGGRGRACAPRFDRNDGIDRIDGGAVGRFGEVSEGRRRTARAWRRELDRVARKLVGLGAVAMELLVEGMREKVKGAESFGDALRGLEDLLIDEVGRVELLNALATAKCGAYFVAGAQVAGEAELGKKGAGDTDDHGLARAGAGTDGVDRIDGGGRVDLVEGFAERVVTDWDPVSPDEAVSWFEDLTPWTEAELELVAQEARNRAFTMAGALTREQVKRVQDELVRYIREGRTLAEFQGDFPGLLAELGLDAMKPYEIENLFRSEVMRAYGAGRTVALKDPEVREAFPMWQYMAIQDDRTRPEHAALHGLVLPADDPFWYNHTPPWDHQCRCDVVPVSRREIEEQGIVATGDVTMPDGTVLSVSQIPGASSGFRGIGM
jgi:SPP1 gp7 family putative phage head morphogenesis protein